MSLAFSPTFSICDVAYFIRHFEFRQYLIQRYQYPKADLNMNMNMDTLHYFK